MCLAEVPLIGSSPKTTREGLNTLSTQKSDGLWADEKGDRTCCWLSGVTIRSDPVVMERDVSAVESACSDTPSSAAEYCSAAPGAMLVASDETNSTFPSHRMAATYENTCVGMPRAVPGVFPG